MIYFSGMTLTSGTCTLIKDDQNLVGISIGGGYPNCPCLFVVQVFDNSPASKDGSMASGKNKCFWYIYFLNYNFWIGDEIVSIDGKSVKGQTRTAAAKMIQACEVYIYFSW